MRLIFTSWWTHNVCTSECFCSAPWSKTLNDGLGAAAVCPKYNFEWSRSLIHSQMFHIQRFNATFCHRLCLWWSWGKRYSCLCHRPVSNSEARTDCQHTSTRGAPCLRVSSPICIHSHMDDVVYLPNPREVQYTPLTAFEMSCDSLFNCVFEAVVGPAASLMISFELKAMSKTWFCHVLTDSSTWSEFSMFLRVQLVVCGCRIVTVQQMFLLLFSVLLFQPYHFVSDRWCVDVQWFQDKSSQAYPNSKQLSAKMFLGFSDGSRNFRKLLSVSWEVLTMHK